MAEVFIPFKGQWRDKMLNGTKTCTSRPKAYAKVGDTFSWFGAVFEVTGLEKHSLDFVSQRLYKQEGCDTMAEFIDTWEEIHPRKGFSPHWQVFVHHFKLLGTADNRDYASRY